jgi:hypothetical protein
VPQVRITFDTNWFEGNEAIVYDTSAFTITPPASGGACTVKADHSSKTVPLGSG